MAKYNWKKALGFDFKSFGAGLVVGRVTKVRLRSQPEEGTMTRPELGELASWAHAWGQEHGLPLHLVPSGCPEPYDDVYDRPAEIVVGLLLGESGYGRRPTRLDGIDPQRAVSEHAAALAPFWDSLAGKTGWSLTELGLYLVPAGIAVMSVLIEGVELGSAEAPKMRGMESWSGVFGKVTPADGVLRLELTSASLKRTAAKLEALGEPGFYLGATRV